nr:MAG TPA: hypothetical protein [Inoviridae sp.]
MRLSSSLKFSFVYSPVNIHSILVPNSLLILYIASVSGTLLPLM